VGPIGITILVVLVAVFAVAMLMDRKRRRLGDTRSGGSISQGSRQVRRDSKGKGSEWGAGGAG
jgi:hypothetical protein